MSTRVSFHTLGCKLNFSESSTLARQFQEGGFVRVEPRMAADVCVVNTCSVTEHSDKKCRNLIRRLHRLNPEAIIAVTGCYAQLKPYEVAAIEGVDLVLSNNDKGALFERVVSLKKGGATEVTSCSTEELTNFFAAFSTADRTRSFLKVQDGCDYKCSYCTIHYARGASRNIPIAEAVESAKKIAATGQREIVLTGINTGDFGRSTGESFIELLRALDAVEGIDRYRISSIEPNLLSDEIIEFCAASAKFQPHFHIPLQSGSDEILALMRRRYTTKRFAERVTRVREHMPDTFFGVDVIVGFPGEGEHHFQQTVEFLREIRPSYLHIFPFSMRAGTPAVSFPNKVSPQVAAQRVEVLESLSRELHIVFCQAWCGRTVEVLFESPLRGEHLQQGGWMLGYSNNYLRVKVPYKKELINNICRVRLLSVDDKCEMIGEVMTSLE